MPKTAKPLIIFPQSTDQAADVLRRADAGKLAVEIRGASTKRGWGNEVSAALMLDTTQLTGVLEHSWQDLTATVAAGTPWSVMQRALAVHGQCVGLDPLWPDRATVGGIVATNDSGSLRMRYGSLRDLIIGMTVVLADGTIAKSGGKVVKNVAGYDIHKLMTGAFGTLGVITQVTFRLHALPTSAATWTIRSNDIGELDIVRSRLADSTMSIDALQLRTEGQRAFRLDVRFASVPEALQDHWGRLIALAAPLAVVSEAQSAWLAREQVFDDRRGVLKISAPATRMAGFLSDIQRGGGVCVAQQSGVMIASLPPDAARVSALRIKAEASDGSLAVLHWPEDVSRPDGWGTSGSSFALMQEIKRRFDPNRILNPGRFLGGI